jgi:cytochrome P450
MTRSEGDAGRAPIGEAGHAPRAVCSRPELDIALWSDEALLDPYPLWRELREAGPAVWLSRSELWALPRYAEVRDALGDWRTYTSSQGVTLNDKMNETLRGITLHTDPPEHDVLRNVLRRPLTPRELKSLDAEVQAEADQIVEQLVAKGTFDAATELARHLPLTIVSTRVGLPDEGRERMLDWAFANFQCFGPMNDRTRESFPVLEEAVKYSFDPTLRARLKPGGWAARLWEAADRGEIPHEKCPVMLNDYWGPSLDTTIFATSSAIWLFAEHPDQWELVRRDPALIPHAVNEVLRLESPISFFSRVTTCDREYDTVTIPKGSRVLMMYGSANRDERRWPDPERFDVLRKPSAHVGFGFGEHACVGQPLARMEMKAVLTALASRVKRFEVLATERAINNILRGFRRLEVAVH